jgi:hypothetical protein
MCPVIPSRQQASQFGGVNRNANGPTIAGVPPPGRAAPPPPIVLQRGPAQGLEQVTDRQLARVQQSVAQAVGRSKAFPLADCNLIEGLFADGTITVGHGLVNAQGKPRAWSGALMVTPSSQVTWSVAAFSPTSSPAGQISQNETQLIVTTSGQVTFGLLVW